MRHEEPAVGAEWFALLALLYAERANLAPARFTAAALAAWQGMMPHSRQLDLFELAVRDGWRANPHLFAAFRSPEERSRLRALDESVWLREKERLSQLLADALGGSTSAALGAEARSDLYRLGATTLGAQMSPFDERLLRRDDLDRSSLVAIVTSGELDSAWAAGGYAALLLCRDNDRVDAAHNLRLFASSPETEMLAAWALVLLLGQLASPAGVIVSAPEHQEHLLRTEVFDLVIVSGPTCWPTPEAKTNAKARGWLEL